MSLVMEGTREGREGKVQVRIEPSAKIALGIFIAVNQHHDLPTKDKQSEMTQAERNKTFLAGLQAQWDDFLTYAKNAREHLLEASALPNPKPPKKKKG
jgi:hypothetical protein